MKKRKNTAIPRIRPSTVTGIHSRPGIRWKSRKASSGVKNRIWKSEKVEKMATSTRRLRLSSARSTARAPKAYSTRNRMAMKMGSMMITATIVSPTNNRSLVRASRRWRVDSPFWNSMGTGGSCQCLHGLRQLLVGGEPGLDAVGCQQAGQEGGLRQLQRVGPQAREIGQQPPEGAIEVDPARPDHHRPGGVFGRQSQVMGDQQHRGTRLIQPPQDFEDVLGHARVLAGGGFVDHQDIWTQRDHRGQRQALPLSLTQVEDLGLAIFLQTDEFHGLLDARVDLLGCDPVGVQPKADLIQYVEGHQLMVVILKTEPHPAR